MYGGQGSLGQGRAVLFHFIKRQFGEKLKLAEWRFEITIWQVDDVEQK